MSDSSEEDEIIEENLSEEEVKKTLELAKIEADKRLQQRKVIQIRAEDNFDFYRICFSPNSKFLATSSLGGLINIWDVQTATSVKILRCKSRTYQLSYSPNNNFIAVPLYTGEVMIWNIELETFKILKGYQKPIQATCVSYSLNGRFLASGYNKKQGDVKIWNVENGECLYTFENHSKGVMCLSYSPDGRFIASGSDDKTITISNVETKQLVHTLQGHIDSVFSLSYSPNGNFLATGSLDNTIKVWRVETGECIKTLQGHTDSVVKVSYSPDGKYVASGSRDKTIKFWSVETWECIKTLEESAMIYDIAYSQNNNFIAGSTENGVNIWILRALFSN